MFTSLFNVVLRSVAIPIVAILLLQSTFLGDRGAFLSVTIALTLVNIISVIFQVIRMMGNAMMLRGTKAISILVTVIVEVASVIGFWVVYSARYN